ncbi:ATP-dependent DNA helicase RecG [Candidatus Saccharibacteria bacterium]|nr:ATP-dependent DNA helicase RecG [Candidatus Saccharibacteria bacterium]MBR0423940.1 ATP-dependent DNA helicase RecG [Candidatus Saccharibacteria bacterium]
MDLNASVETLKGVGPKTAEILKKAGIRTVRDFFYNLPRDYENFQAATSISELRPGKVVVKGKIENLTSRRAKKRNLSIIEGLVRDETGAVKVVWFNQSYRLRQFAPDKEYLFSGTFEFKNGRFQLTSPSSALYTDVDLRSGLAPIYVAHGGLKSNDFRRFLNSARDKFAEIPDLLPTVKSGVRREALFYAHFPNSEKSIAGAREYLAYEELFELILAAKLNRRENEKLRATPVKFDAGKIRDFVAKLPFKLTNAQRRAAWEIFQDMEKNTPMNRLLQGDVGSGKTMVAALAAYEAFLSGGQVAILAPTAILASQHYEGIGPLLGGFGVKTALLTGATKKKPELKKMIASGEVNVVVGTHALLTDNTEFSNLTLVVIDEQHRFGVEQRQKLTLKSPKDKAPHLLAMTATPIPRSLQLTIFGDLDVSILDELPKGRQPIETKILPEIELSEKLYPEILKTVKAGQQVYWICKAIEDGAGGDNSGTNKADITSVKARTKRLQELFPKLKIELLHGKMKPLEKDEVMGRFSEGKIDILVSTTVVEVGVDVPNATLMIIENAEGYGLAQLHQLRGRVGRGSVKSDCFLLTSGDATPSRRLKELEKSSDGFHLAEVDLKMRGPGEIYGALQHGALDLRIASLSDTKLIQKAQKDAENFLKLGPGMLQYKELMDGISKYQQITTLN